MQQSVSDKIIEQLQSGDSEKQREAAFAARDYEDKQSVPFLVQLLRSPNIGVQEAADMALRKIGGKETVVGLVPLLADNSASVRNLSMDILRHVGYADMNSIIKLLESDDVDIRIFAADILGSSASYMALGPLSEALLKDPDVNVRYQAAVSLGDLRRKEAVEALNQALEDEEWVQFALIEALLKIRDESSINALVSALDSSTDLVSSMIVDALGEMGNIKAVPMLLKKLDSDLDTAMRNKIIKAVVNILGGKALNYLSETEKEKFKEYLLVAIHDDDEEIQDAAVKGISSVGGERGSALILKMAARLDSDIQEERREMMINALAEIGMSAALKDALFSSEEALSFVAVDVMSRIGTDECAQYLVRSFWDKGRDLQREISAVLCKIGYQGSREFFIKVLDEHEDGDVLKNALRFIGENCRDADAANIIMPFLNHAWDDVKETALDAVLNIGGEDVMRRFRKMAESPDATSRLMAVYAFGRIGIRENKQLLQNALRDEVPNIRQLAMEAIASLCFEDGKTLEMLVPLLDDENRDVRLTLVEMFGECRRQESIPYLIKMLGDEDEWVRLRAVEALGEKGDLSIVPEIVEYLNDDSTMVRLKVVETLGEMGGEEAFRALLELLKQEDEEIQEMAERALDKIQENMAD
ncbi:MAG: HEAT repeat domain-containing protein [Desulfovibrionales bacterium]